MEPETKELRYVLGELQGPIEIDPGTVDAPAVDDAAPTATDRIPKLGEVTREGVTLVFPGDPGVAYTDPVECRAYYLPVGVPVPTSVAGWFASSAAFLTLHEGPVPQGPDSTLFLPRPAGLTRNHYMVQTIFGFPGDS